MLGTAGSMEGRLCDVEAWQADHATWSAASEARLSAGIEALLWSA